MVQPALILAADDVWICNLQLDVLEVSREGLPREPLYILDQNGSWPQFPDRSNNLWKHVALISLAAMLAS
jgi:hypothetical protein